MRAAMAWPTHANLLHGLENRTASFFFRSRKEKVAAGFCAIPYWDVSIFRSWESIKIINSISKLRIKQNDFKEDLCLLRRFLMETFLKHEYEIRLVTVDHGEGLYVFRFLIHCSQQDTVPNVKALLQPSYDEMTRLNYMQFPIKWGLARQSRVISSFTIIYNHQSSPSHVVGLLIFCSLLYTIGMVMHLEVYIYCIMDVTFTFFYA